MSTMYANNNGATFDHIAVPDMKSLTSVYIDDICYKLPVTVWFYNSHNPSYMDDVFSQLGKFYCWRKFYFSSQLIKDGYYIGVKAYGTYYKLPIAIKIESNHIAKDVLGGLAKHYRWDVLDDDKTVEFTSISNETEDDSKWEQTKSLKERIKELKTSICQFLNQ